MEKYGEKILETILGQSEHFALNHVIFNAITFCSIVIAGFMFVSDILLGLGPTHYSISLATTIFFIAFYTLSRKKKYVELLIWFFIVLEISVIACVWFIAGGITGASLLIALCFLVINPLILKTKMHKIIGFSGVLLTVSGMFIVEMTQSGLIYLYIDRESQLTNNFACAILLGIGSSLCISLVMRSYQYQLEKTNDLNRSLKTTNEQLQLEIEQRQMAEQSLKERTKDLTATNESLTRINQAVESSNDAIGMSTPEGIHFYQNEAFSKMFGYESAEELAEVGGGTLLYADKSSAKEVFHAIMAGGSWAGEVTMVPKKGEKISVLLRADAIKDSSGKLIGLIGIYTDITERKQAEEMLRVAKEKAESATIAKSSFLANMSHEIRTPMNGVIGMTGMLLGTELNAEQREYAETVRNSGESLLGIINDILDYSKIEAGKLDLEIINFDLRIASDEMADLVSIKAHEKGLEFIKVIHHEVPSLLNGDPGRLRQILINLVGNAIKFTENGEVGVRVTLEDEDPTHATIRFSVTDTGIGIPKDRMARLFKSFSQVDSSTTRKYGGTGLGLTISKQLTELMGGQIGINSEEGKGSEFWFTAVFEKQPEGKDKQMIVPEDIREKRILIVDDNDTSRFVLSEQLKLWGCRRYDEVSGGIQALEKLREAVESGDRFELAILDMQMPEMDGEALGIKIKRDPDFKNTILVIMTSLGMRGDAERLKEIGFAAYLTKPVKQSYLYDCLTTVTGKQKESEKLKTGPLVTRHSIAEDRKSRFRILLAEDNKINQKVALSTLGKLGYNADPVANGKEAVSALAMIPYDIVLMDCQMPEMDGYEATGEIRNPDSNVLDHKVPVIAMTAHAMKGDREKCIEAGMDDYLSKPVKPQALSDMLEKWLTEKDSEQ